ELGDRALGMRRPRASRFALVEPHDRPREIRVDALRPVDHSRRQRERDDLAAPLELRPTSALSTRTFHGGKRILEGICFGTSPPALAGTLSSSSRWAP